jgi:bifunctional DNA-binding transcriptional regulator/antitoxin component of YhaV-PrlF toxin-antitoxin module
MSEMSASLEVSLGRQGRLVIPAPLRRVLEKPDRIKRRLKTRFAQVPVERALVDELIAERRESV